MMDNFGYIADTDESDADEGLGIPDIDKLCINPYRLEYSIKHFYSIPNFSSDDPVYVESEDTESFVTAESVSLDI